LLWSSGFGLFGWLGWLGWPLLKEFTESELTNDFEEFAFFDSVDLLWVNFILLWGWAFWCWFFILIRDGTDEECGGGQ